MKSKKNENDTLRMAADSAKQTRLGRRKTVRWYNFLIAVLCGAALACYIVMPFWTVDASVKLTPELLDKLVGDSFEGYDLSTVVDEDTTLEVSVTVTNRMLVGSFNAQDAKTYVKDNILMPAVKELAEKAEPVVSEISEKIVKEYAKNETTSVIQSIIKAEVTEKEAATVMADLGITPEAVGEQVGGLLDLIQTGTAKVSDLADYIANAVDTLLDDPTEKYPELDDFSVNKTELTSTLQKAFGEFGLVKSDGTVYTLSEMMSRLITDAFTESATTGGDGVSFRTGAKGKSGVRLLADGGANAESVESLADSLYDNIFGDMNDAAFNTVLLVTKIVAGVLLFCMFLWVFQILKVLFKFGAKNPGIKVGAPVLLGWIPQLILGYVLTYAFSFFVKTFFSRITVLADIVQVLDNSTFTSVTSGFYPSVIAGVLLLVSLFYGGAKSRLKKALAKEKALRQA